MTRILLLLLTASLLLTAPAFAQDGPSSEKREEIMKRVRTMRTITLVEALDLDEKTALDLSALLSEFDADFMALDDSRRALRKSIKQAVDAGDVSHKDVDGFIAQLRDLEEEALALKHDRMMAVKKLLTPEQRIKFVMVMDRFEREVRRKIHDARKKGRGHGPPDGAPGMRRGNPHGR